MQIAEKQGIPVPASSLRLETIIKTITQKTVFVCSVEGKKRNGSHADSLLGKGFGVRPVPSLGRFCNPGVGCCLEPNHPDQLLTGYATGQGI